MRALCEDGSRDCLPIRLSQTQLRGVTQERPLLSEQLTASGVAALLLVALYQLLRTHS